MIDGYDCGIRYMDGHIGQVLAALEEQGSALDDWRSLSVPTWGESGRTGHLRRACHGGPRHLPHPDAAQGPGCKAGHIDDGLHLNLDLLPTLADLLGQKPVARWDGQSYATYATKRKGHRRPNLVISQWPMSASAVSASAPGSIAHLPRRLPLVPE
jgi:hypothetical protein